MKRVCLSPAVRNVTGIVFFKKKACRFVHDVQGIPSCGIELVSGSLVIQAETNPESFTKTDIQLVIHCSYL